MARWLALVAMISSAPAMAADPPPSPTVQVLPDGTVEGRVLLPIPPARAAAAVADGKTAMKYNTSVVQMASRPVDGCELLDLTVKGWFVPVEINLHHCATADGYSQQLVTAGVFTRWDARWSAKPKGTGTEVTYRIHTDFNLPVPRSILISQTASSVRSELRRLAAGLRGD